MIFDICQQVASHFDMEVHSFDELDSSNDFAKQNTSAQSKDALIHCRRQPAGRGRRGRGWDDNGDESQLFMTLRLKLDSPPQPIATPIVGRMLAEALEAQGLEDVSIKPPNDIYLGTQKTAGLLCEAVSEGPHHHFLVGCGLNVLEAPGDFGFVSQQIPVDKDRFRELLTHFVSGVLSARGDLTQSRLSETHCDRLRELLIRHPGTEFLDIKSDGSLKTALETVHWSDL